MRVAILRREPNFSFSMDVYANGVVKGLRTVRPTWEIHEFSPQVWPISISVPYWQRGVQKYYERYWRYPKFLKEQEFDLFHIIDHSDGYLTYWLKQAAKPTVITCHDLINLLRPDTFRSIAQLPLISMMLWKWAINGLQITNHVVAVSAHTAEDVVQNLRLDSSDITVVSNAVSDHFHPLPQAKVSKFRKQQSLAPEALCLLNVGSNNARKNVDTILQVVLVLKDQGHTVQFWKAGTNFNSDQQLFIQSNDLVQNVRYVGEPDDRTLITLYNAADILIAPSLYEGFGMTILEAMACGTAVITSNVTSLPEVAGDAAVLVDPLDISAMAASVSRLKEDKLFRESLITKGLERVKKFTWENTAEQLAQIYERVC